jgi:hypothetical protein
MTMRAKCSRCGKKITLTHPTKRDPEGSRFRHHINHTGRTCYGTPVAGTMEQVPEKPVIMDHEFAGDGSCYPSICSCGKTIEEHGRRPV